LIKSGGEKFCDCGYASKLPQRAIAKRLAFWLRIASPAKSSSDRLGIVYGLPKVKAALSPIDRKRSRLKENCPLAVL
jgi:hypothetical protein